ncbi:SRPBCC family protein [Thauera sinica]|uniref:SRPBCC family protein n=1 Tax=Thauera sinica TaxID=2665146 RepID=A0ABW1ATD3_9RHOO|nr:SRPBCC family protein [Thauera sp. K11]
MLTVEETIVVNAPVENVWETIGDFGRFWIPQITIAMIKADEREMATPDGGSVVERLLQRSPARHELSYAMVRGDLPVDDYLSTLRAEACTDGTRVTWQARFRANGVSDVQAVETIRDLYRRALAVLKAVLQG